MFKHETLWRTARKVLILVTLVLVVGASPVLAALDTKSPTRPANLRVTSTSAYNISLAWDASTDNSGVFSYRVRVVTFGQTYTVPQSQTTFSYFVAPNSTISFYVYAVDGSGNRSPNSNTVSGKSPADVTAPTAPVVSVAGVNPTEVSLTWTASTDDGPYLFYEVFVNGSPTVDARQNQYAVVHGLSPETTYSITVQARDLYGGNVSAQSNVVTVTTPASGGSDTKAPSAPGNLYGWDVGDGAREINLFWTQSVDNQTPQASIVYEVYLNGVLDHITMGTGRTILYVTQAGENTFTVIAVDSAGNKSAPVSIVIVSQ